MTTTGPRNRDMINLNDGFELRYWAKEFGVSLEQLKSLARKVGSGTAEIKAELQGHGKMWRV